MIVRGDSFPFDFESNGIPFGPENRKENSPHDRIPFNLKGNFILVSAEAEGISRQVGAGRN